MYACNFTLQAWQIYMKNGRIVYFFVFYLIEISFLAIEETRSINSLAGSTKGNTSTSIFITW